MKYSDLPTGALFQFSKGNRERVDPSWVFRKLRHDLAGYDTEPGRGMVFDMRPWDEVEEVNE